MKRLALLAIFASAACGDDGGTSTPIDAGADAEVAVDGAEADAAAIDGAAPDAPDLDGPDLDAGGAAAGFGDITGPCGVLTLAELDGTTPLWFQGDFTFADGYDDPADRDQLTPGGLQIILDGNAGGSSVYSEVFAYEWLARCEQAALIKTENQITYDTPTSKKADLLVEIDGRKVGVSVTRAVTFPFDEADYTMQAATTLFGRKLDDLHLATMHVVEADRWTKQMVYAEAINLQHAQVAMEAWAQLPTATRGDTILVVPVTNGDDRFIYTDQ